MPQSEFDRRIVELVTDENASRFTRGGGPPYDDGMEARVAKLEDFALETRDRLARIETKIDNFERNFATKEDLYKAIATQTRWFVGALFAAGTVLTAAVYFIATHTPPH